MPYPLNYHPCYSRLFSALDPFLQAYVQQKELLIASSPLAYPRLKGNLSSFRRYKSKIRILYSLFSEFPQPWVLAPDRDEVMLFFVGVRNDDTYSDAYKILKQEGLA